MATKQTRQPSPGLTKADLETLTTTQQITLRSFYADASLARFRADKHRKAGKHLQADIQDDIASGYDLEALRYRQLIAKTGNDMEPNAKASQLEWIKGDGVDRDGHSLAWWKSKALKWSKSEYDRPKVYIQVVCWDRQGQQSTYQEFGADDLKDAKAFAKSWLVDTGGTARVEGRVDIPYQGTKTMELGEWKNTASNGYYVWSVDQSGMPFVRRGPFADPDEALRLARRTAEAGVTYDEVVTFGGDPAAGDFEIVKAYKARSGEVHHTTDLPRVGARLGEYRTNTSAYYVWVLRTGSDTPLSSEGPYGPHSLETAKKMARIGATEGIHDRAVSLGKDPASRSFQILRRYAAGTGERII